MMHKVNISFLDKVFYFLVSVFVLSLLSVVVFFSWRDLLSLLSMSEVILFSWRVFLMSFGLPLAFHMFIYIIKFCFVKKINSYNGVVVKFLTAYSIIVFLFSFPVSMYVDNKLKSEGYLVCDKKSVFSPSKYVKKMVFCK
ncbi:DUF1240 domain-containing protein [Xenorhabdus lircayensis]|uniref:DUF1240 domain-containing protein n=1 Tax=Xenorhabdus lircayensis TaxID=2763499 RepID=A0ABS0U167_9GAMM|nr:DUF1240 domain-containing protein [Xenorhabdus lircayensis]